ncbi:asparaginase [Lentinula guzmanii]|uniref:Asparaginase n=1 Tax=Lentinula guzmanii TaxID=2804957 RepID=A0AA38JN05_9AGAR|nr:asparaginase [Lentinula guzmanii]
MSTWKNSMHTFIAVHGGAGSHSSFTEKELKQALRLACKKGLDSSSSRSPLDITEAAITILEDDPNLNAGYGSNLTLEGTVECDAAIMDGNNNFGSVGAVSGVKNPIRLARAILEHSQVPDPLGRIPPLTLVCSGAHAFASQNPRTSSTIIDKDAMISPSARDRWYYWKEKLNSASIEGGNNMHDLQDTVGAVTSCFGEMASGVSSGGLLLKMEGRCGEAAAFGAGCWAQNIRAGQRIGMACSISGTGEYITRSGLARALGKAFEALEPVSPTEDVDPHAIMEKILIDDFWKPSKDLGEPSPSAGILLMTYQVGDDEPIVRVWCAFTTPTMAIAYASSKDPSPKALILRRPKDMTRTRPDDKAPVYMTAFSL